MRDHSQRAPGRRWRIVAALAAAASLIAAPLAAQIKATALPPETPAACLAPPAVLGDVLTLTRSAAVATRTRHLKIVAIGSSSTAGAGASDPAHTWPARLEEELKRRLPNAEITVVNLAEMRQSTQAMIARFPSVLEQHPDIVVWEVGTAEAVRHLDVEDFFHAVLQGEEMLTQHGVDVILVDPQYTRDTARLIAFEPYLAAISRAAQMREVSLFHRHAVMRHWVDSGQFQFDSLRPADFARVADSAYDCIGRLLAHFIIEGLQAGGAR
jgi:lysophospholipase L1-like esterase